MVHSTKPAHDFAGIFLEDALKLMKDDVRRHRDKKLIWDKKDLAKALKNWEGYGYHEVFNIGKIQVELLDAGHILGSAIVKIKAEGKTIIFSGDLGNPPVPIIEDPEIIGKADYVVMESTYGDRLHKKMGPREDSLREVFEEVYKKRGVLLIPAFAMERAQELIYEINDLIEHKGMQGLPVFLDSPLAIKAMEIYKKYPGYFDEEARKLIEKGDDVFDFLGLKITRTTAESKAINKVPQPKVIIAGSGMSTGGRIIEHEKIYLPDSNNTILFIGFQVKGTLGRKIKEGEKIVKIRGREVEVNAEIREIPGYSAHADQEGLLLWLKQMSSSDFTKPKKVFAVHGETPAAEALANKIKETYGIDSIAPKENDEFQL